MARDTDETIPEKEHPIDDETETNDNGWDSSLYESDHSFVHEYGHDVVDLLEPERGERILDLGCGTGHLTNRLADEASTVVGIDASTAMVAEAVELYPTTAFLHGNARSLPFTGAFDAVFSNAALHWIDADEQGTVADSVRRSLRPDGRFVAELGAAGNVNAIEDALSTELRARGYEVMSPWYFPTVGKHAAVLENHRFEVLYMRVFDRPTELDGEDGLRNWLSMFGESFFESVPDREREDIVTAVEDRLRPEMYREGTWVADYRRLRFVATCK
jgi:trans-aconitate methyltransferase